MTTYYTTGSFNNLDDTNFRAWITAAHDMLVGMGLVQTSDTGQADFSTLAKPTSGNTMAGYRMYRFNDSLQGTAPVFVKLEVGTGSSATTTFGSRVTVGSSTNGAGTISSVAQCNSGLVNLSTSTYTGTNPIYGCHTEAAAWACFYNKSTSVGAVLAFAIFRTCDAAGAPTVDGVVVGFKNSQNGGSWNMLRFTGTPSVVVSGAPQPPCLVPFLMSDSHVGVDIQMFPWWTALPQVRQCPYVFSYCGSELTDGSSISAAPFVGLTKTFMPLNGLAMGPAAAGSGSAHGVALVWE